MAAASSAEAVVASAVLFGIPGPLRSSSSRGLAQQLARNASTPRSQRDATVEDEIFHVGYFADVAFSFQAADCADADVVFGQSALFALLSPKLRELIKTEQVSPSCDSSCSGHPAVKGMTSIRLGTDVTVRAFRQIARYVYRLPLQLTSSLLPELLAAAHTLEMPELEAAALAWGLACLDDPEVELDACSPATYEEGCVHDALRCLNQLCALQSPRPPDAVTCWRDALVRAFPASAVFASPDFFGLQPDAMTHLISGMADKADPGVMWVSSVQWACHSTNGAFKDLDTSANAATSTPRRQRRLFGPGVRSGAGLVVAAAPPPVPESVVDWQRHLLPIARVVPFARMSPAEFANHVEEVDPMLPELRQVIYASRRHDIRELRDISVQN